MRCRYRHKGVFYLDESSVKSKEDVRLRPINMATGMDTFDKAALPKVIPCADHAPCTRPHTHLTRVLPTCPHQPLQVRGDDFGKRSRTKWTHLVAEDTTFTSQGAWAWSVSACCSG